MYDRIFNRMKEAIRNRQYMMSLHAVDEMEDDGFSVYDIEHIVLSGKIVDRQKDQSTKEWKYIIEGESFSNQLANIAAKLSITGKLVIITVFKI